MSKILNLLNENITLNNLPLGLGLIELFYIKKCGSYEAVQKVFAILKEQCASEEEFNIKVEEKLQDDFHIKELLPLCNILLKMESFSSILDIQSEINNWAIQSNLTVDKLEEIIKLQDDFASIIREYYKCDDDALRKLFVVKLANKITYTIKETREELGFKNQRTFKKWLIYYYNEKFENKKTINILEYIDIWNKFLLSPDEIKIDLKNKSTDYKKRLDEGLIFSKNRLKNLTKNDYKLLKIEIETINLEQNLQLPENVDLYPFSIVEIFKKHLT